MEHLNKSKYKLKYMKIWNTKMFLLLCLLGVCCIAFGTLIALCVAYENHIGKKIFMLGGIEILGVGLFIYVLSSGIKEMQYHNSLINNGIIVKGTIVNAQVIQEGFEIEARYRDEATGKEYRFKQSKHTVNNVNRIRQMTVMDSDIYILVNEKNMEQGIVLLDEYCNRQDWSEVRTNYPRISEIDNKEGELIKVQGTLVKKSLNVWGRNGTLMIVEADITYFNSVTGQIQLFKGRGYTSWSNYLRATSEKKDIMVDVSYDVKNPKNYVVYLEEAFEKLGENKL